MAQDDPITRSDTVNEPDMLIQELDDVETFDLADNTDEEKFFCARCEKEVEQGVTLCGDCEAIIRKYPFSSRSFVCILLVVLFSFVGIVAAVANFPIISAVIKGNRALETNNLKECYAQYDEAYSVANRLNTAAAATVLPSRYILFSSGNNTVINQFVAIYKLNGPYSAGQYIDQYFGGTVPDKLKYIKDEYDVLSEVYEAVNTAFDTYYSTLPEGALADLNELYDIIDNMQSENGYPQYIMDYYRFLAARDSGVGFEESKKYMESIIKQKPGAYWLYASDAIALYKSSGDYAKALAICSEMLKIDSTDQSALAYSMSILRMEGKLDGAMLIYDKAMKVVETTTELERQKAIALMLQDKFTEAEAVLIDSYDESTLTVPYANTICACATLTGNVNLFESVKEYLAKYDIELSSQVEQLSSGEITVRDIFSEGTGDFT